MRFHFLIFGLVALTGCTTDQMSSAIVKPGKFSIYTCDQIADAGRAQVTRERELKALMDKAAQGPGGEMAITLAYRGEYLTVQGNLANRCGKGCAIVRPSLPNGMELSRFCAIMSLRRG
jgi:hypothetical protein